MNELDYSMAFALGNIVWVIVSGRNGRKTALEQWNIIQNAN
jgi:hypothetical protein